MVHQRVAADACGASAASMAALLRAAIRQGSSGRRAACVAVVAERQRHHPRRRWRREHPASGGRSAAAGLWPAAAWPQRPGRNIHDVARSEPPHARSQPRAPEGTRGGGRAPPAAAATHLQSPQALRATRCNGGVPRLWRRLLKLLGLLGLLALLVPRGPLLRWPRAPCGRRASVGHPTSPPRGRQGSSAPRPWRQGPSAPRPWRPRGGLQPACTQLATRRQQCSCC
mmetsp:Transcript_74589/g.241146  ORF Transcript_74589/g.241146 Transcript_74589/m.241146 type:complete len:227 (-) Transcript_74589:244-924(-)